MTAVAHDIGRRLDALPLGRFHYRLTGLIVGGLFVDQFDNYITGGVLGAAIKEGWSTMSANALFISAGTAGMTIGSVAAGWIGDRYGRRFSFQMNLLIFGIFSFAAAASPTIGWLTVARFLMGLGMGAEFVIAYTMLSEFVPPKTRGRWQASMAVISNGAVFISSLCGFIIIPHYGWRWVFVIAGVAAIVVWLLRKSLPESPRWLESKGRTAEAERVVDEIVHELGLSVAPVTAAPVSVPAAPVEVPFSALFAPPILRRTLLAVILMTMGLTVSYGYTNWLPTFFIKQGMSLNTSIGFTVIMSLGGTLGALIAFAVGDKVDRRPSLTGAGICALVFGILFAQGHSVLWINIFGLLLLGSLFAFTTLSIAVYMPELFATEYRARGAGVAFTCARIGIVATPFPIVWAFDFGGLNAVTAMFSVFLVIALIALWLLGVETRAKPLEETAPVIDQAASAAAVQPLSAAE
ncbi:MAG: MFS transporter [Xanthobacteraceae bacterium]